MPVVSKRTRKIVAVQQPLDSAITDLIESTQPKITASIDNVSANLLNLEKDSILASAGQSQLFVGEFADFDNRVVKKRGRKPKGGKLVLTNISEIIESVVVSNIILHLKCSFQDLYKTMGGVDTDNIALVEDTVEFVPVEPDKNVVSLAKKRFCRNTFPDKKSACFWCTCDFDSIECYIPKYDMDDVVYGYGSFCRPECAAAFLFMEYIDDSVKYERYHLLNRIYGNAGSTTKNIIPAPNPHYALNKFYGSQTIQEYRSAMNSDYMMLVIKNPMTRILPEFHEDCNEFNNNIYGGRSTSRVCSVDSNTDSIMYRVRRADEKTDKPSNRGFFGGSRKDEPIA